MSLEAYMSGGHAKTGNRHHKHAKDKETILVPGKVLSAGSISKQVRVAAFSFSKIAREKIKHAGGSTMQIEELLKSPDKTARILR